MTLGFSTKWPKKMGPEYAGKPNFFMEKIYESLLQKGVLINAMEFAYLGRKALPEDYKVGTHAPKLHTIREDSKKRWHAGMTIHPTINNRTKERFQFAPVFSVQSIQKIRISQMLTTTSKYGTVVNCKAFRVDIDNRVLDKIEVEQLAMNDGFDSVEQFFNWFREDFEGIIIHWTDLRY